jgi:glycosyltransferase involved in cell wall biosynthesis
MVAHSCVMTWWQACRREAAPPEWDRYRAAVAAGLESANAVVAPTGAMLDAFLAEHDPALRHVARARVVHNSVDPRDFRAGPHKLGVVFSAGRVWDEAKNLRLLDTVAGALPWTVAIAGSITAPSGARVELEQAALLGELAPEQLRDMLTHASVYALPARYEPFGLSALEAALSGCALVLGDIPSLRELWRDAALFADPDDALAWETALLRLARDGALRSAVATRCRERALALASPLRFAQEYLEVYAFAARSAERAKRATLPSVWSVSEAPTERAELRSARQQGSVRCA